MDALQPGDPRQVGRYRITGRLGAGGMGQVYLGHSPSGRLVAVKVVRPELAQDRGFRRRFAREVAAARKVTGFFTAALVDADPDSPSPWLATAYVPGMALDEAVASHGPWPVESVRVLGAGLAEALEAIHAAGLVHRDLKPSNVLIAPDGPRVVDFGISVALEATALTHTGMIVGTPGFMAPEQLTGKPVTPATDVFALGAVLTHAATGIGPFGTGSAQILNFRIAYEEPDLGRLPSHGLEIIARCLAKDPELRPSVAALIEELAVVRTENDPLTEVAAPARYAMWLPAPLVEALPTATAVLTSAPSVVPPQPAPKPAARPAKPVASPRSHRLATAPFWAAIVTLALAMLLPPYVWTGSVLAATDDAGAWLLIAPAMFGIGSSVTAIAVTRRDLGLAWQHWARALHIVAAVISTAVCFFGLFNGMSQGGLGVVGSGGYMYAAACTMLIYGAFRFPSPKSEP
ncbi:serine/threonine-protein kinase [Streptomyces sp. NPDC096136]|uniref:serine/threonine-protein kinase n=1 Tax=Streptomyces sp. NPDC096136 TaxID=3366076 RepID=UPI00380AA2CF